MTREVVSGSVQIGYTDELRRLSPAELSVRLDAHLSDLRTALIGVVRGDLKLAYAELRQLQLVNGKFLS